MSLVTVSNLSVYFTGRVLFQDIGFQVDPGERIGLVGPNGSGKTTLLRLLAGEISPDSGDIKTSKGCRVGYLPQDVQETLTGPLLRSVLNSIPGRESLKKEMGSVEAALRERPGKEEQLALATRLAELHQRMSDLERAFPEHLGEKILLGLGFHPRDFDRPVEVLSGGWRMRAALGSLLYQKPDLLLMDEPTNHLDIPSVRWLEAFLEDYPGSMVLISHDRDFLNRRVRRIMGFEPEGLRHYRGDYDGYLKAREEERRTLDAQARNQELRIKEAQKFIERFKAKASKARQAQSKIKLVQKEALVKTHQRQQAIRFSFPEVPRSGRVIMTVQGLSKGYADSPLYEGLDLTLLRGDRVAVIGPNGCGKTTLLKMVAGEIEPDRGSLTLGHGVIPSYYAQHLSEILDPRKTIIEEVYQAVPHAPVSFVRNVCGAFLFSGNDVDKTVGVLSGGEKARVSLAKILAAPGNFLVMDEPTNHLDIVSSEALIDALKDFGGTLLFVSHNQSFAGRLATKIWDIADRGIHEYPGTLYEYYAHLSRTESGAPAAAAPQKKRADATTRKDMRREKAERRRVMSATLKPLEEGIAQLERRIDDLESRSKVLEKTLADPEIFKDKGKSVPLLNEYGKIKKKLDELFLRWEHKQGELASAREELGVEGSD